MLDNNKATSRSQMMFDVKREKFVVEKTSCVGGQDVKREEKTVARECLISLCSDLCQAQWAPSTCCTIFTLAPVRP